MGKKLKEPPRIFHVNWFRKGADGEWLWPGFGENMRVLAWVVERATGSAQAFESPLGWMPHYEDLYWEGLDFSEEQWVELMSIDRDKTKLQTLSHEELFLQLFDHFPKEMIFLRELLIGSF